LFEQHAGFKQLKDERGKPFTNADDFISAKPPFGMGLLPADVRKVVAQAEGARPLAKHGEIGNGRSRGSDRNLSGRGTAYWTARIARDRPDVLERMRRGEFTSVRAAAIEAGVIKPKAARPTLPADPHEAADVIAQRYDKKAIRTLIADLQAVVKGT